MVISIGMSVRVFGMKKRTDLNGKTGTVKRMLKNGTRVAVAIVMNSNSTTELVSISLDNLVSSKNTNSTVVDENTNAQERYKMALEEGRSMKVAVLKQELTKRGISINSSFEKSDLIKAYADVTTTINVQEITNLYHGGRGGQQSMYKCWNKNCDKKETKKGTEFKNCSRCQSVMYCSKKCQSSDWRTKHKFECIPAVGINSTEPKGTPYQRVGQFLERYTPMLEQIVISVLMDGFDTRNDFLCETHVCMIILRDLPPSNLLGKSPRLMTKDIQPILIKDLQGGTYTECKRMMKDRPPNSTNIRDLVGYSILNYMCSQTGSILATSINSFCYDLSDDMQVEHMKNEFKYNSKQEQRRNLRNTTDNMSNTINEMALGNAKKLKICFESEKVVRK